MSTARSRCRFFGTSVPEQEWEGGSRRRESETNFLSAWAYSSPLTRREPDPTQVTKVTSEQTCPRRKGGLQITNYQLQITLEVLPTPRRQATATSIFRDQH